MHELSLAEDMLSLIEDQAKQESFTRVEKVILEVGQLSHVEAEAMHFCFDSVMRGSIGDAAALEIVSTEGIGLCNQCGAKTVMEHIYDPCQKCGDFGLNILQGDQVKIKALEVL